MGFGLGLGIGSGVGRSAGGVNGYTYMQVLTVDHTKVSGSLSNFPVLISITSTALKTVANGGHVRSASGFDIGFFTSAALSTKLAWEVQKYDAVAGTLVAWVSVPLVSSAVNAVLYMGYGNASISMFQGNVAGVWDSGFAGVWHFGDGGSLSYADSTANANDGLPSASTPSVGASPWGAGALSLSGTAQFVNLGKGTSLNVVGAITISAWIKPTDRANYNAILAKSTVDGLPAPYDMFLTQTSGIPAFLQGNGDSAGGGLDLSEADGLSAPANGAWSHIGGTISSGADGATWVWYLNGATNGSGTMSRTNPAAAKTVNAYIGSRTDFVTMFKGLMSDVRLSSVVRSSNWFATEYANQSSPSTFVTSGGEVAL